MVLSKDSDVAQTAHDKKFMAISTSLIDGVKTHSAPIIPEKGLLANTPVPKEAIESARELTTAHLKLLYEKARDEKLKELIKPDTSDK